MKWKNRKDATLKLRHFLDKGKFVKRCANKRTVFEAWKREYIIDRQVAYKTKNVMKNLQNLSMQSAFDLIRSYVLIKAKSNANKKANGQEKMI